MNHHNFYTYCHQGFIDDKIFLRNVIDESEFTYANLHEESGKIANHLINLGLSKGDRVMVQVEKSAQNLFWYFGCLRAGLIYLPLNTAYLQREVEYFVDNAQPSLILCDPDKTSVFKNLTDAPIITLNPEGICSDSMTTASEFADVNCNEDDIATILYTSGTTGKPKGAMITHGNLIANGQTLTETWQWQQDDVLLHALPVFHVHGLFVATHLPVINGSTILFLQKFDPVDVIRKLPESTVYMGVPTNYVRLLANPAMNESTCSNMRLFTSGSAPLLVQTFNEFRTRTAHTIVERYGMTETGMNTSNPMNGTRKPGTVGPPLPGVSVLILDEASKAVAVSKPGDLYVKGKNVFKGYWQMPEKTAEEFNEDGFFKTGDIASRDEDGYISIIGRDKDMIITGGFNVYPKEIEAIIDDIPGVLESAVIGLPHADFGEAVTAIVVKQEANSDVDESSIKDFLKSRIARFKVVKRVHFVDELPRNTMGKVQKNILRERYG
jgi:malonyl-CoA/methylmalonyl-CoA synthetase